MSPIKRCTVCQTRAAISLVGKKGKRGAQVCSECDKLRDWPIHKKKEKK